MLERGLADAKCGALARDLVRPVRRMVEIFRFSTVRLDLRENTTRTTDTLHALWRQRNGDAASRRPSAPPRGANGSRPNSPGRATRERSFEDLPDAARETLATFALVAEMREALDREAFGAFVLSMTRSVEDVLGAYLLAKEAGVFLDAAGTEICPLPIVPLFETIDDLRAAPGDHAGAARHAGGAPLHPLAGRGAGGDDRLFRLEQGRRLRRRELGAVQGAEQADPARPGTRRRRSPSSTGAAAR